MAHRVIWVIHYGSLPEKQIDHVNGDTSDNRIANLRVATASENAQNRKRPATNKSGHIGVHYGKRDKAWVARIKVRGVTTHIGNFADKDSAAKAYRAAKERMHTFQPKLREERP